MFYLGPLVKWNHNTNIQSQSLIIEAAIFRYWGFSNILRPYTTNCSSFSSTRFYNVCIRYDKNTTKGNTWLANHLIKVSTLFFNHTDHQKGSMKIMIFTNTFTLKYLCIKVISWDTQRSKRLSGLITMSLTLSLNLRAKLKSSWENSVHKLHYQMRYQIDIQRLTHTIFQRQYFRNSTC